MHTGCPKDLTPSRIPFFLCLYSRLSKNGFDSLRKSRKCAKCTDRKIVHSHWRNAEPSPSPKLSSRGLALSLSKWPAYDVGETRPLHVRTDCHPAQADEGSTAAWDHPGAICTWRLPERQHVRLQRGTEAAKDASNPLFEPHLQEYHGSWTAATCTEIQRCDDARIRL